MTEKSIPTPETLCQLLRYEPDTGKLFWKRRHQGMFIDAKSMKTWNTRFAGTQALNSRRRNGYRGGAIFNKFAFSHRVAWCIFYGFWPDFEIDHINGIPDDNRIENLRDVPKSVNLRNCNQRVDNGSGTTGVHWSESHKRWGASITLNGKRNRLGWFTNKRDAIAARKAADENAYFTNRHGLPRA